MLEYKLNEDLKIALKSKNTIKVSVIRMLKSDINNTAIKLNKISLDDTDILKVIQKHIKQHDDSIDQFRKANRSDLVNKEESELAILKTYYPKQLSDGELESISISVIKEIDAKNVNDMGRAIKIIIEKTEGAADGKRISQIVKRLLQLNS